MFENLELSTRTDGGTRGDPQWVKMRFKDDAECERWLEYLEMLLREQELGALLENFFLPEKANTILDMLIGG